MNPAELPGSMAVLGLVIEEPDETVTHIAQALDKRFTRARFASSTAHNTLPRFAMADPPLVCCTYQAPGGDRKKARYEATPEGVEVFRSWMFEQPGATPVLRDALYGKIELCQLEDLPRLIEMARKEVAVATDLYQESARRLRRLSKRRARRRLRDYEREMREVLLYADPLHWSSRAERYQGIADGLAELAGEIAADSEREAGS